MDPEIKDRKEQLRRELESSIGYSMKRSRLWTRLALGLMAAGLACSFGAGLAGLASLLPPPFLGAIALVPGAAAIAVSRLKLQGRVNWHNRNRIALDGLRSRLLFQLPVEASAEEIAAVASARDEVTKIMQKEWEKGVFYDWNDFQMPR
jgi:hypothetical protein